MCRWSRSLPNSSRKRSRTARFTTDHADPEAWTDEGPNLLATLTDPFPSTSGRRESGPGWVAVCQGRALTEDSGPAEWREHPGGTTLPIQSLWPKRDESLIELLRRTCTSNCHDTPTIN